MKIGIFGGSFNPPHNMHYQIAEQLLSTNTVDKIIFVPTGMKYEYKNNLIHNEHRISMIKKMIDHHPKMEVSDFECQEEVVYTYQTMDHFQKMYPSADIYFICGTDNLSYVEKWKEADYLMRNYKFLVVCRSTDSLSSILEKKKEYPLQIEVANISPKDISSTEIREKIKENHLEEVRPYLPPKVYEYIVQKELYKEK